MNNLEKAPLYWVTYSQGCDDRASVWFAIRTSVTSVHCMCFPEAIASRVTGLGLRGYGIQKWAVVPESSVPHLRSVKANQSQFQPICIVFYPNYAHTSPESDRLSVKLLIGATPSTSEASGAPAPESNSEGTLSMVRRGF